MTKLPQHKAALGQHLLRRLLLSVVLCAILSCAPRPVLTAANDRIPAPSTEALIRKAPQTAELTGWKLLYQGVEEQQQGNLEGAVAAYSKVPIDSAAYVDAQLSLALLLLHDASPDAKQQEAHFEEWLESAKRSDLTPMLLFLKGSRREHEGAYTQALSEFQQLRRRYPKHPLARKAAQKSQTLVQQVKVHTSHEMLLTEVAALIAEQRYSEATQTLDFVLQTLSRENPADTSHFFTAVELLQQLGAADRAALLLHELSLVPRFDIAVQAGILLAKKEWNQKATAQAAHRLAQIIREFKKPSAVADAHYLLGRIQEEMQQQRLAAANYRAIPVTAAVYAQAQRQLAWIRYREQDTHGAIEVFRALAAHLENKQPRNAKETLALEEALHWSYVLSRAPTDAARLRRIAPLSDYALLAEVSPLLSRQSSADRCAAAEALEGTALPSPLAQLMQRLAYLSEVGVESFARHEIHWYFYRRQRPQSANPNVRYPASANASLSDATFSDAAFSDEVQRASLLSMVGAHTSALRHASQALRMLPAEQIAAAPCVTHLLQLLYPRPYYDAFASAAGSFSLPLEVLFGVTRTESHFDPLATSGKDARGLMQLLFSTARREGMSSKQSLYDPQTNIYYGAKHLAGLLENYRELDFALAAYNAGPTAVARWRERYPTLPVAIWVEHLGYEETRNYVRKVRAAAKVYSTLPGIAK